MRPPETFQTPRLSLRPVELKDARQIYTTYAGEAAPTHYMNFARHWELEESEAFALRCIECWKSGSAFAWAVESKSHGAIIGVIDLRLTPPKADFGYIYGQEFWGQGFATEAAAAVVNWAIAQPEIFRVWATCYPDNLASAAVLQKVGLSFEATLVNSEARPQLGEVAGPSHCYAMVKLPD